MSKSFYIFLSILFLVTGNLFAQITIGDGDLVAGETYNWTNDNEYILDGYVYLEAGGVLNIEAGTVIKGMEVPSTNDAASALIITKDAKIFAEGTSTQPIIFSSTAAADDDDETVNGLWGGLIVLGNGTVARPGGSDFIEGIPNESRTEFGGGTTPNDTESSGVLKYISIRHGGAELAPGSEINGLTLGAVGSGTEIDYIEIFANSDDGVEFFGGTVGVKHLVSAFCGDDGTDYDFGWRGKGQYWFMIQRDDEGGNGGEHDGAKPDGEAPFSKPTIYNATYIGSGATSNQLDNEFALLFRDNAAGTYANSIFTDFADKAISVEDLAAGEGDAHQNLVNGDLVLKNNIWFGFGAGTTLTDIIDTYAGGDDPTAADVLAHLGANTNQLADPTIAGISRTANAQLDPRLNAGSPALTAGDVPTDGFFDVVAYHGAFNNSDNWALGWTALDQKGYFGDLVTPIQGQTICVQDADLEGGQTYFWTKENTYCLDGYVYLEAGGILNIEAGTTIYGMESPTSNDAASALIIARDAQIFAEGTTAAPIIFTAEGVVDGSIFPDETVNGLWGGLVVLGNGTVARPGGSDFIEGIPNESRTEFGGGTTPNDTESSGVLKYVSIRHGGAELAPGSEINGLTLGAVGSGTEIDYVEIYANSDDGIEWFGGTVNVKHLISAFCGDDGMDYDFGWRGKGQYWFMIQGEDEGGNGGEHDGAKPDGEAPFSKPTIYNATYIGSGANSGNVDNEFALLFRDNAGGTYANSIFTDFYDKAISVEDLAPGEGDSHQNLLNGDLNLLNNIWYDFGAGTDLADIVDTYASGDDVDASDVIDHLTSNNNTLTNPEVCKISRIGDGGLNPILSATSPAANNAIAPTDSFFDDAPYSGAFNQAANWAAGWTALSAYGHLGSECDFDVATENLFAANKGYILNQNTPNPAIDYTSFEFVTPTKSDLTIEVYNVNGQLMTTLLNEEVQEGKHNVEMNITNFASGTYFVVMTSNSVVLTRKMTVLK
ncbi:MAG: T9SS type A sorting domain-containing protein [Saprospiraceae bacterium]